MSIRTDIFAVDWDASPRIIWIDIAFTEVTAQDLYDTCKHLEAIHSGMDEPPLCDAGGWEPLGGSVFNGITVSLFNAQYAFADRPGPEWVICNMTGGNVVAFTDDTRTVELYPRFPTAFVSADRTASSSATTQEQAAIQYSSFNDMVAIDFYNDTGKAVSGTVFPAGTRQQPALTLDQALEIANKPGNGFKKLWLESNLDIASAVDLDGFVIQGNNHVSIHLSIVTEASVANLKVLDCTIDNAVLDGDVDIARCVIVDIVYLNGHIHNCGLLGTISLGGSKESVVESCYTVDQDHHVIIDMGGSGNDLSMPNYSGLVTVRNLTSPTEEIGIGLNAGMIIFEDTVTEGTGIVAGNGLVMSNAGPNFNLNVEALMNISAITESIMGYDGL